MSLGIIQFVSVVSVGIIQFVSVVCLDIIQFYSHASGSVRDKAVGWTPALFCSYACEPELNCNTSLPEAMLFLRLFCVLGFPSFPFL